MDLATEVQAADSLSILTVEDLVDFLATPSNLETYRAGLMARVIGLAIHGAVPNDALMYQIKRLQALLPELHRGYIQHHINWHEAGRRYSEVRRFSPSVNATPVPSLGEMIRAARTNKGWTQEVTAEQMGVSQQAVAKWEAGSGAPRLPTLKKLIRILGVDERAVGHARLEFADERAAMHAKLELLQNTEGPTLPPSADPAFQERIAAIQAIAPSLSEEQLAQIEKVLGLDLV